MKAAAGEPQTPPRAADFRDTDTKPQHQTGKGVGPASLTTAAGVQSGAAALEDSSAVSYETEPTLII